MEDFLESRDNFRNKQVNFIISLVEAEIEREMKNNFRGDNITVSLPDEIEGNPLDLSIVERTVEVYVSKGWNSKFIDNIDSCSVKNVKIVLYPHEEEE